MNDARQTSLRLFAGTVLLCAAGFLAGCADDGVDDGYSLVSNDSYIPASVSGGAHKADKPDGRSDGASDVEKALNSLLADANGGSSAMTGHSDNVEQPDPAPPIAIKAAPVVPVSVVTLASIGVKPDKVQDSADDGDTADTAEPSHTAVRHHSRHVAARTAGLSPMLAGLSR